MPLLVEGQNMPTNGHADQIVPESICSELGKQIYYEAATLSERQEAINEGTKYWSGR